MSWGDETSLSVATLASPADQVAKQELRGDLQAKYGTIAALNAAWGSKYVSWDAFLACTEEPDRQRAGDDLRAFYEKFADTYFRTVKEELSAAAPAKLYLGCRFAWQNDVAVNAAIKYCDVVSYNRYAHDVSQLALPGNADKPLIICEFHFGAVDRGMFHAGLKPGRDQEHRAELYKRYVHGALRNPIVAGAHWFQYAAQPTTGRPDGENYDVGLVDICDNPHPELVEAMREVGHELYEIRTD